MKKIKLLNAEAEVLEKIAHRSKMDSWFSIETDKNGNLTAREKDIHILIDGATEYDLETLTNKEIYCLVNLLVKCIKLVQKK